VEITKSDILKLIEVKRTDTIGIHLLTILKSDFRPAGEVRNREIRIWRQNGWNGMFYPIFQFDLNQSGNLINISDRLNPAGKLIFIIFCLVFSIPWLNWILEDSYILEHWTQILGWFVFLSAFILISLKIYKMEKQMQLDQIYGFLDMEIEPSETPKEWGWKRILVRLITYSLSIFLIIVCILAVIPQGKYFLALSTLTIIGAYLYTDLTIILKNKKPTSNNK